MSDKTEKKEAAAAGAGEEKKAAGGGLMTKLPVLLGGVMVVEAAIIYVGHWAFSGPPKSASAVEMATEHDPHGGADEHGEGAHGGGAPAKKGSSEVHIVDDFRAPNKISGHTYFYDVTVVAQVKGDSANVKDIIEARGALIKDRIRTIIAESDPDKLGGGSEPGLETFRRQVKFQLDEIIGDGRIDEVLVPKCIPFRADF